jgi:uncharacterized protein (TIGR02246 family)
MTDIETSGPETPAIEAVLAALADFDRAFAAGDAEALADMYAEDGLMLLLYSEPMEGRPAILEHWTRFFGAWDTTAWRTEHPIVEVHGDHAFTLSTYTEKLVHRGDEPSRLVAGRLVRFLRRDRGGSWRVATLMNSHTRPVEEVP